MTLDETASEPCSIINETFADEERAILCGGEAPSVRSGASTLLTAEAPLDETPAGPEVQTGSAAMMLMMCLASISVEGRGRARMRSTASVSRFFGESE